MSENGTDWEIVEERDAVQFSTACGPWFFIRAAKNPNQVRWIQEFNDRDFEIDQNLVYIR